jgi:medium-chain acyl-[acyl-carrier-protein] hydrolase
MSSAADWMRFREVERPRLRVFALSFAGGAAQVFRPYAMGLPADVELRAFQLPGRWNRIKEPPFTSMGPLVEDVVQSLTSLVDLPFVFFGYSLGAIVAFELAHRLLERGLPAPARILLVSRASPDAMRAGKVFSQLPDADFVHEMDSRYGGIPEAVKKDAELMAMVLPALRADMQTLERYEIASRPPLAVKTTLWFGEDDLTLTEASLSGWREHVNVVAIERFPGGHFFAFPPKPEHLQKFVAFAEGAI